MNIESWVNHLWYTQGWRLLGWLLLPLSLLFLLIASTRRWWLQRFNTPLPITAPVVIIGNISVGGVGKTPLTLSLAEHLQASGLRVGIISRGFGRSTDAIQAVTPTSDPAEVGDEPALLARHVNCPVYVGRERARVAQQLEQDHEIDIILSDDGMQHYALERDLEICVIDGHRGMGNKLPLPGGPLRELPRRTRECDFVIVNSGDYPNATRMDITLDSPRNLHTGETLEWADFCALHPHVHAVAGIGNPARFFTALRQQGLDLTPHPFEDHHPFRADDFALSGTQAILITEKDAVKCQNIHNPRIWVVPARAQLPDSFWAAFQAKISPIIQR